MCAKATRSTRPRGLSDVIFMAPACHMQSSLLLLQELLYTPIFLLKPLTFNDFTLHV